MTGNTLLHHYPPAGGSAAQAGAAVALMRGATALARDRAAQAGGTVAQAGGAAALAWATAALAGAEAAPASGSRWNQRPRSVRGRTRSLVPALTTEARSSAPPAVIQM